MIKPREARRPKKIILALDLDFFLIRSFGAGERTISGERIVEAEDFLSLGGILLVNSVTSVTNYWQIKERFSPIHKFKED